MQTIREFISTYWVWLGPITITLLLALFLRSRNRPTLREIERLTSEQLFLETRMLREYGKGDDKPSALTHLLQREDVSLRVLEEVYEPSRVALRREWRSPDAYRLNVLENLQREIRSNLRSAVQSEDFPQVRDRLLTLLDEIKSQKDGLQNKEPFNDIQDPEKSLLIDIFQELDASRTVIRQKTLQLANIIKLKHQDILKLQAENAKAATWTKWGTAGTVVFGILSIVLSVVSIKF